MKIVQHLTRCYTRVCCQLNICFLFSDTLSQQLELINRNMKLITADYCCFLEHVEHFTWKLKLIEHQLIDELLQRQQRHQPWPLHTAEHINNASKNRNLPLQQNELFIVDWWPTWSIKWSVKTDTLKEDVVKVCFCFDFSDVSLTGRQRQDMRHMVVMVTEGTHLLLQHPLLLLNLSESLEQLSDLVVRQLGRTLRLRASSSRLTAREKTEDRSQLCCSRALRQQVFLRWLKLTIFLGVKASVCFNWSLSCRQMASGASSTQPFWCYRLIQIYQLMISSSCYL